MGSSWKLNSWRGMALNTGDREDESAFEKTKVFFDLLPTAADGNPLEMKCVPAVTIASALTVTQYSRHRALRTI